MTDLQLRSMTAAIQGLTADLSAHRKQTETRVLLCVVLAWRRQ